MPTIVYDIELRRPACVLLQAAMGGDTNAFNRHFGGYSECWLIAPTPDMRRFIATEEELEMLVDITMHAVERSNGKD